jgi:hypothetical protein
MRRIASLVAIVLLGAAGWGAAQGIPEVAPGVGLPPEPPTFQIPSGAKVRVRSSLLPGGVVEGRVTSSTDDALGLMLASDDSPFGGGQMVIPRTSVASLQMSMGRHGHTLLGLLVGTASFAAIGAFVEVDPNDCGPDSSAFCSRGEAIGGMALVGAGIGALAGAAVRTERWQNVSVEVLAPRSSGLRAAPRSRGGAFAAQIAFRF